MDKKELWDLHEKASEALGKIPGVVSVGLGPKEVKGELTNEVALLVYVEEKKPAADLEPEALIPSEYEGLKTDVQRIGNPVPFGSKKVRPLCGGVQIRREPDQQGSPKPGTLTYIATRTSDNEKVILSCEHVLLYRRADGRRVFQPDTSECCGIYYNRVGKVVKGTLGNVSWNNGTFTSDYMVDAAIAEIKSGIGAERAILNISKIAGPGDLSTTPTEPDGSPIVVQKTGSVTGYTRGEVADVTFNKGLWKKRLIRIRPKSGHTTTYSERFTIDTSVNSVDQVILLYNALSTGGKATKLPGDVVEFTIPAFGVPGDSGAAIVDMAGRIVGILAAGDNFSFRGIKEDGSKAYFRFPGGEIWAIHIGPVLSELGIKIDPSTKKPEKTTTTRGKQIFVPGAGIDVEEPDEFDEINARLGRLEQELAAHPAGQRVNYLVKTFADELIDLVHTRRSVTVAWHRAQGPAFVALMLKGIREPGFALPKEVKGVRLVDALEKMHLVLKKEGSPALQAAIDEHAALVYALLTTCSTAEEMIASLKAHPEVVS